MRYILFHSFLVLMVCRELSGPLLAYGDVALNYVLPQPIQTSAWELWIGEYLIRTVNLFVSHIIGAWAQQTLSGFVLVAHFGWRGCWVKERCQEQVRFLSYTLTSHLDHKKSSAPVSDLQHFFYCETCPVTLLDACSQLKTWRLWRLHTWRFISESKEVSDGFFAWDLFPLKPSDFSTHCLTPPPAHSLEVWTDSTFHVCTLQ